MDEGGWRGPLKALEAMAWDPSGLLRGNIWMQLFFSGLNGDVVLPPVSRSFTLLERRVSITQVISLQAA